MLRQFRIRLAEGEDGESKGKRGGPPPGWQKFVDQKLKGRKVPNPDKDSSRKEILITTAMKKDKSIYDKVMKEYAEWAKKQKSLGKKKPSTNKEKETKDNKKAPPKRTVQERIDMAHKFMKKFDSGVDDMDEVDFGNSELFNYSAEESEIVSRAVMLEIIGGDIPKPRYKNLEEVFKREGIEDADVEAVSKHMEDRFISQASAFLEENEVEVSKDDLKRAAKSYVERTIERAFAQM